MSWYDDPAGRSGPPTERLPSFLGPGFPDTHPIRSHRHVKERSSLRRWLSVVTVVLVLAAGGFLAHRALGDGPSAQTHTPDPRPTRSQMDYGLGAPSLTGSPRPSPTSTTAAATPTASAAPSPSAPAPTSSAAPPSTRSARAAPPPPPSTPPPTSRAPTAPPFVAFTLEAERGTLLGVASPVACGPCSGGWRVGYIDMSSAVVLTATISQSGTRTFRVTYETDGPREIKIEINGVLVDARWVDGTGWEDPLTFQFSRPISAGALTLRFYNDTGPAPDIDAVTIS